MEQWGLKKLRVAVEYDQDFDSRMHTLRENAAHIDALQEYFYFMQKCFKEAKTDQERLDILAVCKEINHTARRVRNESDALRKSALRGKVNG